MNSLARMPVSTMFVLLLAFATASAQRPANTRLSAEQPFTPASQGRSLPFPPKRIYSYKGKIEVSYERFQGATVIHLHSVPFNIRGGHPISLGAMFSYKGQTLSAPPEKVLFLIRSYTMSLSTGWLFLRVRDLTFLVDGEPLPVGTMEHKGDALKDGLMEHLSVYIPTSQFLRIVNAKEVEMQVGAYETKLDGGQLDALRDFASRMNPQNKFAPDEVTNVPPKEEPTPKVEYVKASLISKPQATYPAIARAARATGRVTVEVQIDEKGDVISAQAVSGHPLLQQAAAAAARQAKFTPATRSGQPVKASSTLAYEFICDAKFRVCESK